MPIHRAAIRGYTEVVHHLLKGGADPNSVDYEGYTPLHFAAKGGHYESAEVIYRAGGDPLRTNDLVSFTLLFLLHWILPKDMVLMTLFNY